MQDCKELTAICFNGKIEKVKFLGDTVSKTDRNWGYKLFLIGNTFGVTHLIGAKNLSDAVEWYQDDVSQDITDDMIDESTDSGLEYPYDRAPNGGAAYMGDIFCAQHNGKEFVYIGMLG